MEPAPIGMAVAVARRLWAGTVPSWCTGHLRGVRAEKGGARQRKGAFSSSASHWAILKQPIRGGQAICEKVSVTCEPGCRPQERRAEPSVPCHVRGPVSPAADHGLCLAPGPSLHSSSRKEKAAGVVCSFGVPSGVVSKNWGVHKEPATCALVPKAAEYFKIIVSLYVVGCF